MTNLPEPYITAPDEACIPCLGDNCPDADKCTLIVGEEYFCTNCGCPVEFKDAEKCVDCMENDFMGDEYGGI
jgi:hypothetical protein